MDKFKYRWKFLKRLYPMGKGIWNFYIVSFGVSLSIMLSSFVTPLLYKQFINRVILDKQLNFLINIVIGYFILFVLTTLLKYIKQYTDCKVVNRITFRVKCKLLRGLFACPFPKYDRLDAGAMKMRMDDDILQIPELLGKQTIDYIIQLVAMLISVVMLFLISWQLALFSVLAIPLTFWIDHLISKREKRLNDIGIANEQDTSTWLYESIKGWKEVRALNLQKKQTYQFVRFAHEYALFFGEWINYWVLRVLIMPKIKDQFLMQFGLYFLGGILIIKGRLHIGDFLVFVLYYGILSTAMNTVSTADAELQSAMPYTDRLFLGLERNEIGKNAGSGIWSNVSDIVFKNVDFAYPGSNIDIVNKLSFKIAKGERVAITGRSGAGKTTILKLMLGMYKPTNGKIEISGVDVKQMNLDKLYKKVGTVMQENMLLNTTIRENLQYGKRDAGETEMWNACKNACIDEFVKMLPKGLDTVIGERGVKLSGGQKQRIVLARLFLKDVDVYIFDEATSALDQYSESIIHDAIKSIGSDKTIIIVAHRESSIKLCQRVIQI